VSDDEERRARAAARSGRLILHKTSLQSRETDLSPIRGIEALSLATRLSFTSWRLAGKPMPAYSRHATPIRFVPRGSK